MKTMRAGRTRTGGRGLGLWLPLVLAGLPCTRSQAQTTGAAFLKIDTGARPAAMGGAYTAVADDINALYYNPAGLSLIPKRELGATHTEWVLGSKFDFVGFGQPTSYGTFGLGLTRLGTGSQEVRGADGRAQGSLEASDMAYTLGFGRSFRDIVPTGKSSLGVNVKYLESSIGSDKASTFAFDLGVVHKLGGRPLSLGFSVLNLGRGMRFLDQTDPLPLTFSAGASYKLIGALGVALDVRHEPYARSTDVGIGTEYAILSGFMLRAGYASLTPAGAGGTPLSGLGGGFGFRLGAYSVDYAFTPFGELGNVQRISLGACF